MLWHFTAQETLDWFWSNFYQRLLAHPPTSFMLFTHKFYKKLSATNEDITKQLWQYCYVMHTFPYLFVLLTLIHEVFEMSGSCPYQILYYLYAPCECCTVIFSHKGRLKIRQDAAHWKKIYSSFSGCLLHSDPEAVYKQILC